MSSPVTTLDVGGSVADARAALLDNKGSSLPIVDSRHRPLGIVTKSDLVASVSDELSIAVIMSKRVATCSPTDSVVDAARRMRALGRHHLVVVADEIVVGMLSSLDLLQVIEESDSATE